MQTSGKFESTPLTCIRFTSKLAHFNDLWKFEILTGMWTWISGDSVPDARANYGTVLTASTKNKPGARQAHSMALDNDRRVLYVFGGYGYASTAGRGMCICILFYKTVLILTI